MDKLNLAQVKMLLCAAAELIKDKQQELTDIDGNYQLFRGGISGSRNR